MKYTIDLPYETMDEIIINMLNQNIEDWERDLLKDCPLIFERDPELDKKIIRKHIKAARRIIAYYSVPSVLEKEYNTDSALREWEYDGTGIRVYKGTMKVYP